LDGEGDIYDDDRYSRSPIAGTPRCGFCVCNVYAWKDWLWVGDGVVENECMIEENQRRIQEGEC